MDVLKRVFGDWKCFNLRFPFSKKRKEKSNSLSKYEYYVYKFQSIVIWERPTQTVSSLLLIQLLFWMIVNLCWKFYGIIFTLLLIFCTHDVWTEKIWPEIKLPQSDLVSCQQTTPDPRILTTSQIEEYFNNFLLHVKMTLIRFKNLRSSHPMMFCSMLSFSFGLLTIIGCTISGIWLLYMVVMAMFLSPGVYIHVLSQSLKVSLKQYLNEFAVFLSSEGSAADADDEYVPKLSDSKLDEAYASVFQLNDTPNDFLSVDSDGMIAVRSFDDSSVDDIERFDDMKINLELSESSSISSDFSENIKFQGSYFNNLDNEFDTSEDEKAFLPDPQYRGKVADVSMLNTLASSITFPGISQLSRNLLNNIMPSSSSSSQSKPSPQPPKHCSTDDEFEFVDESDVN